MREKLSEPESDVERCVRNLPATVANAINAVKDCVDVSIDEVRKCIGEVEALRGEHLAFRQEVTHQFTQLNRQLVNSSIQTDVMIRRYAAAQGERLIQFAESPALALETNTSNASDARVSVSVSALVPQPPSGPEVPQDSIPAVNATNIPPFAMDRSIKSVVDLHDEWFVSRPTKNGGFTVAKMDEKNGHFWRTKSGDRQFYFSRKPIITELERIADEQQTSKLVAAELLERRRIEWRMSLTQLGQKFKPTAAPTEESTSLPSDQ
jgi:hypothetical protein